MNAIRRSLSPALVTLALGAAPLIGQVPDGWFTSSTFKNPNSSQLGGLQMVHPRSTVPLSITGLGAELTGAGTVGVMQGASCVHYRRIDGTLVVGELAHLSQPSLDIHVITLSGSSVATQTTHRLGTVVGHPVGASFFPYGSIDQLAPLPNGEMLFVARGCASPALGSSPLGRLDVVSGAITAVPMVPLPAGTTNALAVDLDGGHAYVAMFASPSPGLSTVYRVPLPLGGAPFPVATFGGDVLQLAIEPTGFLVAGIDGTPGLLRIDPATGAVTNASPSLGCCNAFGVEAATGNLVAIALCPVPGVYLVAPNGVSTFLFAPPPHLQATTPSGLDLNPDPEIFGAATPGASSYDWVFPNPGGLPVLGNAAFSLTLATTGTSVPGLWIVGVDRLVPPLALPGGLQLNIAWPFLFGGGLAGAPLQTIALPIPVDPALTSGPVYFQTLHLDPSGQIGASAGLALTVLR
jgi:hypothetical protein